MDPAARAGLTRSRVEAVGSLVLAIDHRDSLRVLLPEWAGDADIVALKADLVAGTADLVDGVMLDPRWGMTAPVLAAAPPGGTVIAALEAQGYLADDRVTHTTLLEGWGAADAVAAGATAVKLLSLWTGAPDGRQDAVVAAAQQQAAAAGVPLVSEPLPRGGLAPSGEWVLGWVAHAVAGGLGDVLKVPHPGSSAACRAVAETVGSVPWLVLSAGAPFAAFADQLGQAVAAGAAGAIVGRAVWREAITTDADARAAAIDTHVRPRLETLRDLLPAPRS